MAENIQEARFSTRVQLKYDTLANWNKVAAETFKPLKGEICIVAVPNPPATNGVVRNEDTARTDLLIKVGDGNTYFENLPWLSALAADVHSWAKDPWETFIAKVEAELSPATDAQLTELGGKVTSLENRATALETFKNSFATEANNTSTNKLKQTLTGLNVTEDGKIAAVYEDIVFPEVVQTVTEDPSEKAISAAGVKTYVDGQVSTINGAITGINNNIDEIEEDIVALNTAVEKAQADATQGITDAATAKGAADNAQKDATQALADAKAAQQQADKGVADALAAHNAANAADAKAVAAQGTADANAAAIDAMQLAEVKGTGIEFIQSIKQVDGVVTAEKGTIPTADADTLGVVKLKTDATTINYANTAASYDDIKALEGRINTISNNITNAMHFVGVSTTAITDGGNETPTIGGASHSPVAGDVVLYGGYEYVYTTTNVWEQLGQEGSFAVKGSIVDADIASGAAIQQTKIAGSLEGNATLQADITELNDRLGSAEGAIGSAQGAIDEVGTGLANHIADKENPHEVTKTQIGLGNVTDDKQVKAIEASTADHILVFAGTDGATIKDSGKTIEDLTDAIVEAAGKGEAAGNAAEAAQSTANTALANAATAQAAAEAAQSTANTALANAATAQGEVDALEGVVAGVKATAEQGVADALAAQNAAKAAQADATQALTNAATADAKAAQAQQEVDALEGVVAGVKTTAEQGISDAAEAKSAADAAQGTANNAVNAASTAQSAAEAAQSTADEAKRTADANDKTISEMNFAPTDITSDDQHSSINFITSITQENGKITNVTKQQVSIASEEDFGLVTLGGNGAYAAAKQSELTALTNQTWTTKNVNENGYNTVSIGGTAYTIIWDCGGAPVTTA